MGNCCCTCLRVSRADLNRVIGLVNLLASAPTSKEALQDAAGFVPLLLPANKYANELLELNEDTAGNVIEPPNIPEDQLRVSYTSAAAAPHTQNKVHLLAAPGGTPICEGKQGGSDCRDGQLLPRIRRFCCCRIYSDRLGSNASAGLVLPTTMSGVRSQFHHDGSNNPRRIEGVSFLSVDSLKEDHVVLEMVPSEHRMTSHACPLILVNSTDNALRVKMITWRLSQSAFSRQFTSKTVITDVANGRSFRTDLSHADNFLIHPSLKFEMKLEKSPSGNPVEVCYTFGTTAAHAQPASPASPASISPVTLSLHVAAAAAQAQPASPTSVLEPPTFHDDDSV